MEPTSTKQQRRTERVPLSRERIARAGLEIADREGIDGLSMRRLADELNAGTMTLYWHFGDKEELLDAIIDVATNEQEVPELAGSWRDQVKQLIGYLREIHVRHPSVVEIWARQPVLGAGGLRGPEAGLQILRDAGFGIEGAVNAFRLLITYVHAFSLFSLVRSRPDARHRTRVALASLPPDRYPRLTEAADVFASAMGSGEAFSEGLERILDGLEVSLAAE